MLLPQDTVSRFPAKPKISDAAKDLISKLICDPVDRYGKNGAAEIRNHPFFQGIQWDTIYSQTPPWVPVLSSPIDTSWFFLLQMESCFPSFILFSFPFPTSSFDEVKLPEGTLAPNPTLDTEYNLYGFTYRGFYNLTRRGTFFSLCFGCGSGCMSLRYLLH